MRPLTQLVMETSVNFFDRHPRFYENTGTKLKPNRFVQRYQAIIHMNKEAFLGARVLDLASHDGRWSMAALDAGAQYIEGVEGRLELVARSFETFKHYEVPCEK